jgi:hypothetical protein
VGPDVLCRIVYSAHDLYDTVVWLCTIQISRLELRHVQTARVLGCVRETGGDSRRLCIHFSFQWLGISKMQWALVYLSVEQRLCGQVNAYIRKTCLTT